VCGGQVFEGRLENDLVAQMTGFVGSQVVNFVGGQGAFEDIDLAQLSHKSVPSEHDVAGVVVDNRVVVFVFTHLNTVYRNMGFLSDLIVVYHNMRPIVQG
tara:strand:- start:4738 stop:5037 length:300 start_codon:yes stop_codon:yes gene_type:complete